MDGKKLISAWLALVASLYLLALASRTGVYAFVVAAIPVIMIVTGATRSLLTADYWAPHHIVIGSLFALLSALPLGLMGGSELGYTALVISLVSLITGGWAQIRIQPTLDEVPAPAPSPVYSAKVAMDDAILSCMTAMAPRPTSSEYKAAVRESETAYELFAERGWIEKPWEYHQLPPALSSVNSGPVRIKGCDCEHIHFQSGYEPPSGVPGRERWLSYEENRNSHTYVLRHKQPAPWLICVHGAGMGRPNQDFQAFRVRELHRKFGLNVALFTLPVHGLRAPGGFGGEKFLGVSVMDFVHAEAQSVWDLRRLIHWIRNQDGSQVGLSGVSLGAYTSAVLAAVEDDLACVIAGVPPSDLIHTRDYLAGSLEHRLAAAAGVDKDRDLAIHSVVSPLALPPRTPQQRSFIYAATADQFVPIEQVRALWLHWHKPRIVWCEGGHISAMMQRDSRRLVADAIASSFAPQVGDEAQAAVQQE